MLIIATHVPMRGLDIRHMTFYSKSCALWQLHVENCATAKQAHDCTVTSISVQYMIHFMIYLTSTRTKCIQKVHIFVQLTVYFLISIWNYSIQGVSLSKRADILHSCFQKQPCSVLHLRSSLIQKLQSTPREPETNAHWTEITGKLNTAGLLLTDTTRYTGTNTQ